MKLKKARVVRARTDAAPSAKLRLRADESSSGAARAATAKLQIGLGDPRC
jgi:hypothetical protein